MKKKGIKKEENGIKKKEKGNKKKKKRVCSELFR